METTQNRSLAIGIDLGTTYSCVGVWVLDHVEIIANDQGNRTTPSCVSFNEIGRLIGDAAVNQAPTNHANTVYEVKRLIGRRFTDETVKRDIKLWPFKVIACPTKDNKPAIVVNFRGEEKHFFPEQISAMILQKMKATAEAAFLHSRLLVNAVITVPAYFNNSQRQATMDAAAIAGLNVLRIINEPTAAAIAYDLANKLVQHDDVTNNNNAVQVQQRNALIFDLGGGTFDVSVVVVGKGEFEVKAINGDTHLGGVDFDNRMVDYFAAKFRMRHHKDIRHNPRVLARLRAACERAKRTLTSSTDTVVEVDCLYQGIDFSNTISRARFEMLNLDLFRTCMELVEKCLMDANMEKTDIDDVVLVGGSTRIPKIQQLLQQLFHGKELCKSLNPDEAVACGAAMQAAILSDYWQNNQHNNSNNLFTVMDVTPFSLGTELDNGEMDVVIPRNTPFPTEKRRKYITTDDNQTIMETCIYEGESPIADENTYLGGFVLNGIAPAPKGVSKVIDCFKMDHNGILTVSSTDESTGSNKQITINHHSGRLSNQEMHRMWMESMRHSNLEREIIIVIEAKNKLENYVNNMWDIVSGEFSHRLEPRVKKRMEAAIQHTIGWLDWNPYVILAHKYNQKMEDLKGVCEPIIAKMQQEDANGAAAKKPKIGPE